MKIAGICLLAVLLPLAARAEEGGSGACRADVQKYCSATRGDRAATLECLLDHQQEMTDGCYSFLKMTLERQRRQGSSSAPETERPDATASMAPHNTIYKLKGPDGRIVYTNTPFGSTSGAQVVKLDRVIDAVPIRPSARSQRGE